VDIAALLSDPKRLELVAQPIVDVRRGEVVGYEALARFVVEPRTSPDRVFAEATRQGLGAELEAVVIARGLELAAQKPDNAFLALNVDPGHLMSPAVEAVLDGVTSLAGIAFELTEHRAADDTKELVRRLDGLRRRGAFIAVDDAGSGYSGLKQILELRPQILKVDRELVTNVHEQDAKYAMIQMLGELAGRLDAWLLAEGVETDCELSVLRQLGVPLAQGYFLARPSPPWGELLPDAREQLLAAPPSLRQFRMIRALLEPCTTCRGEEGWPNASLSLRVTAEGRPLAMRFVVAGAVNVREEHELLRVKPDSSLPAVAQRAAMRSERVRWDPIVCVDERGNLRGIVRMSRLVCALADGEMSKPIAAPAN
jgi:EAL domain-containing protein (putative c-di-GMP-specific phosphodiesterase class I)